MAKRAGDDECSETIESSVKRVKFDDVKKHTLDSDEEDVDRDKYNILDDNDIEGEEEEDALEDERPDRSNAVQLTAFNMHEELQMGHFDRDGHFIWNNEKEVRDNWLDNVDWQRVSIEHNASQDADDEMKGLADDSDEEEVEHFDHIASYQKVIAFLRPGETVSKALKRLGGDLSKLSSIERLKRKKAGTLTNNQDVTELTELANGILTHLGNMDVYTETYEQIQQKLDNHVKKNKSKARIVEAELDMYSDDFDSKEKCKLVDDGAKNEEVKSEDGSGSKLMWEIKWDLKKDNVEGPFDSMQMNKWAEEGHFKTGVWVRKCGDVDSNFYSSNRIDFELYL